MAESISISLITEVDNILAFQVRGNLVLIKPTGEDVPRTDKGILLPESSKAREGMLSQAEAVVVSKGVKDITPGDTVYFYRQHTEGAVRQGQDIYFMIADYNIKAVYSTPPLQVSPDGDITA